MPKVRPLKDGRTAMCLAIPGRIIEVVDEGNRLARVDVAGVQRNVNIGLLDADEGGGVGPGDWVLIHVGFALSQVDEDEARPPSSCCRGWGRSTSRSSRS